MAQRIDMPSVGQTTDELVIVEWLKHEGDTVALGESLFSVQTDKAQVEVESVAAGTLLKVVRGVGETVQAGSPVAYIGTPGEVVLAPQVGVEDGGGTGSADVATVAVAARESPVRRAPETRSGKVSALPAARRLASELDLDLTKILGTGQDGVITLRDVQQAAREASGDRREPGDTR